MGWIIAMSIWFAISIVIGWFFGRLIRIGTSELQPAHAPKHIECSAERG